MTLVCCQFYITNYIFGDTKLQRWVVTFWTPCTTVIKVNNPL